jgi:hypothetical protein
MPAGSSRYNCEHRHSGIGLLTPEMVHYGKAAAVTSQRRIVLASAFDAHPERFVRGVPVPPSLPEAAWINKPKVESKKIMLAEDVPIPGVVGDEEVVDRQSWGNLESNISSQADQCLGNDSKFESEVSHYH